MKQLWKVKNVSAETVQACGKTAEKTFMSKVKEGEEIA